MWRVTLLYTYNLKCYCIWPLLSICAQQVLISRVSTALHVHGCTAVHSCHLKNCYWQSLVIVNIRAKTAESIQMLPEQIQLQDFYVDRLSSQHS